jgi:hypothetical protein
MNWPHLVPRLDAGGGGLEGGIPEGSTFASPNSDSLSGFQGQTEIHRAQLLDCIPQLTDCWERRGLEVGWDLG